MSDKPENIQAELAMLADGTLPAERREQVLALLADSPELTAELEDQRRAVAVILTLASVQAPSVLRRSIETSTAGASTPARSRPVDAARRRRSLPLLPRLVQPLRSPPRPRWR